MILNVTNAAARLSTEFELPQGQVQSLYLSLMVMRSLCHMDMHSLESLQKEAVLQTIEVFAAQTGVVVDRYISLLNAIQEEVEHLIQMRLESAPKSSHKPARPRARRTKPHTKD